MALRTAALREGVGNKAGGGREMVNQSQAAFYPLWLPLEGTPDTVRHGLFSVGKCFCSFFFCKYFFFWFSLKILEKKFIIFSGFKNKVKA